MSNSAEGSQLIWINTVCKGRVYLGSAGQGLKLTFALVTNQINEFKKRYVEEYPKNTSLLQIASEVLIMKNMFGCHGKQSKGQTTTKKNNNKKQEALGPQCSPGLPTVS